MCRNGTGILVPERTDKKNSMVDTADITNNIEFILFLLS